MTSVSVVGLGKLGSPMLAVLANAGVDTIGYDIDRAAVDAINEGRAPVDEAGLQDYLDRNRPRIRATHDLAEAVAASSLTFIVVPTPSDADGVFTNAFVTDAMEGIGRALRQKDSYHNVVVASTVMPGSMDGPLRSAIEGSSGRRVGPELGFCYNPEFIALGTVIRDMEAPDVLLIGQSDDHAGEMLEAVHARYLNNAPSVRRMNWVNTEITKLAINTFVTTKISYANMLSGLCDTLEGADIDVVTGAVGADSRVGAKYLKGAVAYGGPCFPRDNRALATLGRLHGVPMDLADATDRINDWQTERFARLVAKSCDPGATVAVLGMSYKPSTAVCEASQGIALARRLHADGYTVRASDPMAFAGAAPPDLPPGVETFVDHDEAMRGCDVVVIATPWPQYRSIGSRTVTIIDPWGGVEANGHEQIIRPGRGGAARATSA
jgi:UDPglucose 6-dehydrogenase